MSRIKVEPKAGYGTDKLKEDPLKAGKLVIESSKRRTEVSLNRRLYSLFYDEIDLPREAFVTDRVMNVPEMPELPRRAPKDAIGDGISPIVQIIIRCVNRGGTYSYEDIYRYVAKEKKFIKDSDFNYKRLKAVVSDMWDQMYLKKEATPEKSEFKVGPRSPDIGEKGIFRRLEEGKHPTKKEIRRFVKDRGSVEGTEIASYMVDTLNWLSIYESPVDTLKLMLEEMVDKGYLEKFGQTYSAGKAIPPRGE